METILNAGRLHVANCNCEEVQEQQPESQPTPEEAEDSSALAVQEVIANEVKQELETELAAILELVDEAFEHLFRTTTLIAQRGVSSVVYDAEEHVFLE